MPSVEIPNGFTPRPYQKAAMRYFDNGGRRAITVWHRRAGKDLAALHQTCKAAHLVKGLYWHVFPMSEEARRAIWMGFTKDGQRIMEQVFPAAIRKSPREFSPNGEMVVELKCGSVWRLMGSDRMSVVGAGPKGVVFSEFALAKPTTWDLVRPMLRESGGWAWFITTPRGNNHAKKLYDAATPESGWFRDTQTVDATGLSYASNRRPGEEISAAEMLEEERLEGMPLALIDQEYRCDWNAANVGSYYGDLLAALDKSGRIGLAFEAETDNIFTSWDLGRNDDTAIWWWRPTATGVDVLDHYAQNGMDLEHYFAIIDERARRHGWRYAKHWLPHDARARTLATKVSVLDQALARFGGDKVAIGPELSLLHGIQAARWLLQQEIRFHARCSEYENPQDCDGVEALRSYRKTWDPEAKCFRDTPVHDWASHTADAFRYLACVVKVSEVLTRKAPENNEPPRPPQTLAELKRFSPKGPTRIG